MSESSKSLATEVLKDDLRKKFDRYAETVRLHEGVEAVIFTDNVDLWREGPDVVVHEASLIPIRETATLATMELIVSFLLSFSKEYGDTVHQPTGWLFPNTGTLGSPQIHLILGNRSTVSGNKNKFLKGFLPPSLPSSGSASTSSSSDNRERNNLSLRDLLLLPPRPLPIHTDVEFEIVTLSDVLLEHQPNT